MKRFARSLVLCLCAALVLLACAGCSGEFDATKYVKGLLDNIYLDDSSAYVEMVDITAEEAHESYLEGLETEAQVFYNYMNFDTSCLTEETEARVLDLYHSIYQHSNYEVQNANKSNNGYTVVVKIYPIDIFDRSLDEIYAFIDVFNAKIDAGDYDNSTYEEMEQAYQDGVLSICEGNLDSIDYLDPVEQTVQIKEDSDGLWGMSDEDFSNLDAYIIQY